MCPSRNTFFDCEDLTGIKIFSKFGFFTVDFNTLNLNIRNHILNYKRTYTTQQCKIIFDKFLELLWFLISRLKVFKSTVKNPNLEKLLITVESLQSKTRFLLGHIISKKSPTFHTISYMTKNFCLEVVELDSVI